MFLDSHCLSLGVKGQNKSEPVKTTCQTLIYGDWKLEKSSPDITQPSLGKNHELFLGIETRRLYFRPEKFFKSFLQDHPSSLNKDVAVLYLSKIYRLKYLYFQQFMKVLEHEETFQFYNRKIQQEIALNYR